MSLLLKALLLLIACGLGLYSPATAETLKIQDTAPSWMHVGATLLLFGHIGGGALGLGSGLMAGFSRKGGRMHRISGKVFFVSMFVAYLIGAGVAPFLETGQRPNFVAGILALYLLVSGAAAARTKAVQSGWPIWLGAMTALLITTLGVTFFLMGAGHETGTVDGSPPQAFVLFIVAGGAALIGEASLIWRKRLIGKARIARHLWRMCASFFFASGSLFFGQPQVFPDWFNASLLPLLCGFLPLFLLVFFMVKTAVARRPTQTPV